MLLLFFKVSPPYSLVSQVGFPSRFPIAQKPIRARVRIYVHVLYINTIIYSSVDILWETRKPQC